MTIRQQGGIFGRNPTFNDLDVEGSANLGSNVDINGGAIDGAVIGAASPAASSFTSAKVIGSNTGAAVDVPNAVVVQNTAGSAFGQGAPVKFFHGAGDTDNNYTAALIGEYGTWSPTNGLGGGLGIYTKNSGVENKPSKKAEFTFTGNLAFNSGLGIDFSATSGTGTSELFDDYEEGTWTPAFSGGDYSFTYNKQKGSYTKIGNRVYVDCVLYIHPSTAPSGTVDGNVSITGLPYAFNKQNDVEFVGGIIHFKQLFMTTAEAIGYRLSDGGTSLLMYDTLATTYPELAYVQASDVNANSRIRLQFSYPTNG